MITDISGCGFRHPLSAKEHTSERISLQRARHRKGGNSNSYTTIIDTDLLTAAAIIETWSASVEESSGDVEKEAKHFQKTLERICDVAIPRARTHCRNNVYWWTPEIAELRSRSWHGEVYEGSQEKIERYGEGGTPSQSLQRSRQSPEAQNQEGESEVLGGTTRYPGQRSLGTSLPAGAE